MSDLYSFRNRRTRLLWYGLLGATGLIFGLAMLPPLLPTGLEAAVRSAFAPVCHQMPSRSLHIGGVPVAICDRCSGIYLGLFLGVASIEGGKFLWGWLGTKGRYLLLGAVGPLAIDWVGPLLGVWSNGPTSRILTGFLFGVVAASYVTHRMLRKATRTRTGTGFDLAE